MLSEADFHRLNGTETRNVSVWARFAQPARLAWAADEAARSKAVAAVARAAPTLLAAAGSIDEEEPLDWWRRAFALTYSAELRAERKGRAGSVVDSDRERYERFSLPAMAAIPTGAAEGGRWARRRLEGKLLSVLRLAKASATYITRVNEPPNGFASGLGNRPSGVKRKKGMWGKPWPKLSVSTSGPPTAASL